MAPGSVGPAAPLSSSESPSAPPLSPSSSRYSEKASAPAFDSGKTKSSKKNRPRVKTPASVPPVAAPPLSNSQHPPGMFTAPAPVPGIPWRPSEMAPPIPAAPAGSCTVQVERGEDVLQVVIPPPGMFSSTRKASGGGLVIGGVVMAVALSVMLVIILSFPSNSMKMVAAIPVLMYPLALACVLYGVRNACLEEVVIIRGAVFTVRRNVFGWRSEVSGNCAGVTSLSLIMRRTFYRVNDTNRVREGRPATCCVINEGPIQHRFGDSLLVNDQQWVLVELAGYIRVPVLMLQGYPSMV